MDGIDGWMRMLDAARVLSTMSGRCSYMLARRWVAVLCGLRVYVSDEFRRPLITPFYCRARSSYWPHGCCVSVGPGTPGALPSDQPTCLNPSKNEITFNYMHVRKSIVKIYDYLALLAKVLTHSNTCDYFTLLAYFSRIDPLCFLARGRRRRLNQGLVVAVGFLSLLDRACFLCYFFRFMGACFV